MNNQISDLNGQVETLQNQQSSSSQNDDNSKYTNIDGETVTPSADTQKVLDKIDTNADYMSNLYRNGLIGNTTGNSQARNNGGYIISDTYGVDEDADSGDNYSLAAGGDDQLIGDSSITTIDDMNQNYVIDNKLNDVDPVKNGQLTTDQERELAIIVANKLNNTREKLGLSRWVMTEKDFELAQRRASQQSAINLQHNLDDINSVFGGIYGENLALALFTKSENINSIMRDIDASVAQLIDSDKGNDYGHRDNILSQDGHIALGIKQVSNDTIMITMDWFDSDDENGTDLLALPAQLKAQGPTKKATVVVDNSAKIAQLKSQIADLQTKLANVQFNYDKLSSSDKKNYDNLKNEIEVTHTKANNARNTLKQNSQASIDQVTQTKTSLYNTLYDLQDQMKTLQDKLVLQKTKLVQLQEELKNSSKSDDKGNVAPVTPEKPSEGKTDDNTTPEKPSDSKTDDNKSEGKTDDDKTTDNKDNVAPVTPEKPSEGKTDDVAPVTPEKPSEGNKDDVAPVTPEKSSEGKTDDVAPVTPEKPSEGNKDNVAPVTPEKPSEGKTDDDKTTGNKDNVAPVTPEKPSEGKTNDDKTTEGSKVIDSKSESKNNNGSSATDAAKQAINQSKGQTDFSDKENVIALPDGSKLVNLYSQNGLVRHSATVLKDGTVRNIHEQLVRKTSDGKTIAVTQGQDGSQTVYVTDKNGNTQSVKFNDGNIVNYSRQAAQPKSDLAQTGSSSNVSESAALVEVALIFIAGLTGFAGMKLMKMKENK